MATSKAVLLFGANGQVGKEILLRGSKLPKEWRLVPVTRAEVDLTDLQAVSAIIRRTAPVLVINAAAYTNVDLAESQPDLALAINRDAPAIMAQECATLGTALFHISTDYVFDGSKAGAYGEEDPVAPLGVYGVTKEAGERAVREVLSSHIILRTSWVFGAQGKNFVKTMLRLAGQKDELGVVNDQRGGPTPAAAIAEALLTLALRVGEALRVEEGQPAWGTFHFSGTPAVTWYRFAEEIFAKAELSLGRRPRVNPIATVDYPTPARRPMNSELACDRLKEEWGIEPPDWRKGLEDVLAELQGPPPAR